MTRWFLICAAALLPCMACAQTIPVRSGEHGAFTRLVLDVPDGTTWALAPDPESNRVTLRLSNGPYKFETSSVFDRIGRDRVAGFTIPTHGAGLSIELGCQCAAEVFVLRGTMLVVDIAPSDSPVQTATGDASLLKPLDRVLLPSPLVQEFSEVRLDGLPRLGPATVEVRLLPYLAERVANGVDPFPALPVQNGLSPNSAIGGQLAADLAVAATQGLLDPAVRSQKNITPDTEHLPDPEIPADLSIDPSKMARRLASGLSGLDHNLLQDGRISVGGDDCIPDVEIAISTWAKPDDDPSHVLATLRGKVFGEFDRIQADPLKQFAKALLYYGFGVEARSALSLQTDELDSVLHAVSYIVDSQADPLGVFDGLSNCNGAAALWAVLSSPPGPNQPEIARTAILRNFEALPKHLRSHLGPTLFEHLAESGYSETAREVLRRLERMEGFETDSIALGKARIDLAEGLHTEAARRLHDLSISGGPEAAKAVSAAVDLAEATDTDVPTRIVELSDAFATELRNNVDGQDLWKAHVRSLLINGTFDAAFSEFENAHGIPEAVVEFMQQVGMRFLVERADDVTFLKLATRSLADGLVPKKSELAIAFAERFLELGLSEVALRQLDASPAAKGKSEERILRAEALILLSRPEEAEIILIGQRGERVVRLRAEARRQMGDHVLAKTILEGIGEERAAIDSAWLSGDWNDVAESDSALAPAAGLMQSQPEAFDVSNVSLAAVNDLSDASAKSRQTLRALLDATAFPPND